MSVRNTIKMLTIAGAATAILPGVASAANPTFGDWAATGGTIDNSGANCPTGFTCEVTISGDGFLQSTVSDGTTDYVQTIVTDTGASGDASTLPFSDENYVRTDGTSSGIAARQTTNDTATDFSGSVSINTGWAAVGGSSIDIQQGFTDDPDGTGGTGDEFANSFGIVINLDATGGQTGKSMDIDQDVALGSATDRQVFAIRQRTGDLLTTTDSLTLDGGTPVSWTADTDDVMVAWIGQTVDVGTLGTSIFGFESVTNATTATTDSTFSQTDTDVTAAPFDWDVTTFGSAPSL